jgi:type II secretory pathway pseudopilin PulG
MMKRHFLFPISYFLLKGDIRAHNRDSQSTIGNRQWAMGNRQSAFSFIEVLFAVILLGIGFIMIAGIFPVAIQQTSIVSNETQGSAVIRDAIKKIQATANSEIGVPPTTPGTTNSIFQPTLVGANPTVAAFSPNIMQALGSDSFFSADRRFGWVGFYRRDSATSPFAQVFIIALQNPNFPNYTTRYAPGETTAINPAPPILPVVAPPIPPFLYNYASPSAFTAPTVLPAAPTAGVQASITANFSYDANVKVTTVTLTGFGVGSVPNGATGAFVLVGSTGGLAPNMVGRFFRLGGVPPTTSAVSGSQTFYLQPGYDITDADVPTGSPNPYTFTATIFVIGAAPTVGPNGEFIGPFTGPNQDIAAGSAFIRVNTSNN